MLCNHLAYAGQYIYCPLWKGESDWLVLQDQSYSAGFPRVGSISVVPSPVVGPLVFTSSPSIVLGGVGVVTKLQYGLILG
jgi:hypothetical protein